MARLTAQEAALKQATRLKASVEDIRRGIQRVDVAPGVKAAAKQDKMRANLVASIDSGKWARNVASVSLEEWKRKAGEVGVNRIASGIDAARDKVTNFFDQLLPYQDAYLAEIRKMPDISLQDNIARMTANVERMSRFTFRKNR
jgi:hypothetical protein